MPTTSQTTGAQEKATGSASAVTEADVTDAIQGGNPFVGLTGRQVASAAGRWLGGLARHPVVLAAKVSELTAEQFRVLAGGGGEIDPKDRRFADPVWQNGWWRRVALSYLALRDAALSTTGEVGLDEKSAERARFALMQVAEALAPTNSLLGNPVAIKRVLSTHGKSLVDGSRHLARDMVHNGGLPSQVDRRPFAVGVNTAATPGHVIHATAQYELIEYLPTTRRVRERPLLIIPPQVNRYYFLDLAPGRSFVEFAVSRGLQVFLMSWRNPTPAERDWSLDTYVGACLDATEVVREVSATPDVNVTSFCAGGITLSLLMAHLSATGNEAVHAAAFGVTGIDSEAKSTLNMFATKRSVASSLAKSRRKGILDGATLARTFAWIRPNDLIWNYWVNNYLLGLDPPAFDVLAWNADSTNLPAVAHAEFLHLILDNALLHPGIMSALGTPVDLGQVKNDIYVVGALTDHLVPWQSTYAATQVFGGDARFVLSNSGHIQALVNPPGNPKASFMAADEYPEDPDTWYQSAQRYTGSWWSDWAGWIGERSGDERPARRKSGSRLHPAVLPAPGQYVHQR